MCKIFTLLPDDTWMLVQRALRTICYCGFKMNEVYICLLYLQKTKIILSCCCFQM